MTRNYEGLFIIEPDAASARFDQVKTALAQDLERYKGAITRTKELGQRQLSYPIGPCSEGFYYLLEFAADSGVINDIRGRYRLNNDVLRFMITVRE